MHVFKIFISSFLVARKDYLQTQKYSILTLDLEFTFSSQESGIEKIPLYSFCYCKCKHNRN